MDFEWRGRSLPGRELDDDLARELISRAGRSSSAQSKLKAADRLAAAKAEHARRRADQLARHEIRIHSRVDALLLVAEKACPSPLARG